MVEGTNEFHGCGGQFLNFGVVVHEAISFKKSLLRVFILMMSLYRTASLKVSVRMEIQLLGGAVGLVGVGIIEEWLESSRALLRLQTWLVVPILLQVRRRGTPLCRFDDFA